MFKTAGLAALSLAAMIAATSASAQTSVLGIDDLDDQIDDIQRDVERDMEEATDEERFSPLGVAQGIRGSAALTASGTTGNNDTADLSFAGRLTIGQGEWSHLVGFAGELGEDDGDRTEADFFAIYEATRALSPEFYLFGTGRYQYDRFGPNRNDLFIGGGPGYRILNTPDIAWRVQAGPGVRYVNTLDGDEETELAGLASSRFFYGLSDRVSVTNDTDVLFSDEATDIINDLGVNFRVSNNLSTRISYLTDYTSEDVPGTENTDNTLGLSLVVGF